MTTRTITMARRPAGLVLGFLRFARGIGLFGVLVWFLGLRGFLGARALTSGAVAVAEPIEVFLDPFSIDPRDSILVERVSGVDFGGRCGVVKLDPRATLQLAAFDELLTDDRALAGLDLRLLVDGVGFFAVIALLDAAGAPYARSPPRAPTPGQATHRAGTRCRCSACTCRYC